MKATKYHATKFLVEEELQQPSRECPFCHSGENRALTWVQRNPDVELLSCMYCSASFVSRFPTQASLDAYYRSYYEEDSVSKVTIHDPARLARNIVKHCRAANPMRVLDFGGGDGSISFAIIRSLNVEGHVTVVDYESNSSESDATKRLVSDLSEVQGEELFDVVLVSSILEHLVKPRETFDSLLSLVKPGGLIYARTPYMAPLMQVATRIGIIIELTFPGHLADFGQKFWDNLPTWHPSLHCFQVLSSHPSPVETGFANHPLRTAVAMTMKFPYRLLKERWPYVGGWEWIARRVA